MQINFNLPYFDCSLLIESRGIAHSFTTVGFMSSGWLEVLTVALHHHFIADEEGLFFEKLNNRRTKVDERDSIPVKMSLCASANAIRSEWKRYPKSRTSFFLFSLAHHILTDWQKSGQFDESHLIICAVFDFRNAFRLLFLLCKSSWYRNVLGYTICLPFVYVFGDHEARPLRNRLIPNAKRFACNGIIEMHREQARP